MGIFKLISIVLVTMVLAPATALFFLISPLTF